MFDEDGSLNLVMLGRKSNCCVLVTVEKGVDDRNILRAVEDVRHKIDQRRDGTDSLRFLTWLFRRCPEQVSAWLLDSWDQEERGGHPIFRMGSHWKLAYQGLGRIASGEAFELRAIRTMLSRTIDTWKWQKETAAMAFSPFAFRNRPTACQQDRS